MDIIEKLIDRMTKERPIEDMPGTPGNKYQMSLFKTIYELTGIYIEPPKNIGDVDKLRSNDVAVLDVANNFRYPKKGDLVVYSKRNDRSKDAFIFCIRLVLDCDPVNDIITVVQPHPSMTHKEGVYIPHVVNMERIEDVGISGDTISLTRIIQLPTHPIEYQSPTQEVDHERIMYIIHPHTYNYLMDLSQKLHTNITLDRIILSPHVQVGEVVRMDIDHVHREMNQEHEDGLVIDLEELENILKEDTK